MGYYTRHQLTIIEGDNYTTDYEQEIAEVTQYFNCFEDEIKWYDQEKDMIKYSKKHPNTTFMIEGEGEDSGDIWRAYYKNGKMFRTIGIVHFEDYSEDKLN